MEQTFDYTNLDTNSQNIFGIDNPDGCRCSIVDYTLSHYTMTIRIALPDIEPDENKNLYLIFDTVLYFSGPFRWQGANFRLSPFDEYVNLRQRIQIPALEGTLDTQNWPDSYIRAFPGRLLYVNTPNVQIQIMAHSATLSTNPLRPYHIT